MTQSGATVTATDAGWNASIPAGGTAEFGFLASVPGSANDRPATITLNGRTCAGG